MYKDTNARMNIKTCRFENVKTFSTIYFKIKAEIKRREGYRLDT